MKSESYFDGKIGVLILTNILGFFLTVATLGICLPWALCARYEYFYNHTVIEGKRLNFTGKGGGLFLEWLKILFLSVITLGIYGLFAEIIVRRWITENLSFKN